MDVRFRPWSVWPQPTTPDRRSRYTFKAKWSATLAELDRELRYLDARDIVIETNHPSAQVRLDGWLRADAGEPHHPGVILSFTSRHGPLRYACDSYNGWQSNVRAILLTLEALRGVERWGAAARAEQYRGWSELPSGASSTEAMRRVLLDEGDPGADLDPGRLSEEGWRSVYRAALKSAHPDAGGTPERLRAVRQAAEFLGIVEPRALGAAS